MYETYKAVHKYIINQLDLRLFRFLLHKSVNRVYSFIPYKSVEWGPITAAPASSAAWGYPL